MPGFILCKFWVNGLSDRDPLFPLLAVFLGVWRDAKGSWHPGSRKPSQFPRLHDDKAVNLPWWLEGPSSRHLTSSVFLLQQQPCSGPPCALGGLAWQSAELEQPPQDHSMDGGNRITQMTQEMAEEVLLMAQSLRSRGRLLVRGLQGLGCWKDWATGGKWVLGIALQGLGFLAQLGQLLHYSELSIFACSLLSLSTVS